MNAQPNVKKYAVCLIAAIFVFGLDQVTKWLITRLLPENASLTIWPGFFDLVNIRNRGAAFGFLNRSDIEWQFWLFLGATLIAIWAILILLRGSPFNWWLAIGLGFLLGGALGNMLDRILYRSVIDFLDFYWGEWHWPAFNVADMAICAGAGLTCLSLWRQKRNKAE